MHIPIESPEPPNPLTSEPQPDRAIRLTPSPPSGTARVHPEHTIRLVI